MIKLPRWFWIAAFLVSLPTLALAEPIYALEDNGVRVVLTDEPCQKSEVANLQFKATWTERGQTYEGCWGPAFDRERINAWFSDRTVVSFPPSMFKRVVGT